MISRLMVPLVPASRNKKGIALETAVALIIGIVFLIVVIYMLLKTGLLSTFQVQFYGLVCTASTYGRGILVGMIMTVWTYLSIAITILIAISGGMKGVNLLKSTSVVKLTRLIEQAKAFGVAAGVFGLIGFLSLTMILTYIAIIPLISNIPLFCPAVTISVGTQSQPASAEKLLGELSSSTVDCWNMYGAGTLDPLIGIDPPNPRECRIIQARLSTPVTAKDYFDYMLKEYSRNWPFGSKNDKISFYCDTYDYSPGKSVPISDLHKCQFVNANIFIMYFDKHNYDLVSYGTGVCNGEPTLGEGLDALLGIDAKDKIVICIEDV